jgi:hypothetical protein
VVGHRVGDRGSFAELVVLRDTLSLERLDDLRYQPGNPRLAFIVCLRLMTWFRLVHSALEPVEAKEDRK